MIVTSLDQWLEWAEQYSMLPCVAAYEIEEVRPASWTRFWERAGEQAFVLESGKGGRYTFAGFSPVSTISGKGGSALIEQLGQDPVRKEGHPIRLIREWMQPFDSPQLKEGPKFIGGCVGFLGYDVARHIEKLPVLAEDDLNLPDFVMMRFESLWIIDSLERKLYCAVHTPLPGRKKGQDRSPKFLKEQYEAAVGKLEQMKTEWDLIQAANRLQEAQDLHKARLKAMADNSTAFDTSSLSGIQAAFGKDDFIRAVEKIQTYIAQGDVFQVNLSVRQSRELHVPPEEIYEWLRLLNPSPYMGMLRLPGLQLVSGSPELLVAVEDGTVRTRPIAGTRPRGSDEAEDVQLAEELIGHEKERAEHIMLVDLLRNDLGRVSRYGSVRMKDFMVIERYSHVMHIVSEVRGQLSDGKTAYDAIAAAFPGGTITGAPKVRTMEIIEELEPVRRGPYTGSIGWIDYNGNMELNITIRTLVATGGVGYVQAGAGIVIDSVPEKEYSESLNKAKALWHAILLCERHGAADSEGSLAQTKEENR